LGHDKLFENIGNGTFKDVSKRAGIIYEGNSLGLNTSDINGDGWIDVYISNDFVSNDILYINNGDGTFSNELGKYFKHTSFAGMGNDVADINNDGLLDVYVTDMYPVDYYREKTLVAANNFRTFYFLLSIGYEPQYVRNVLQINNGNHTFSEIGQLAGIDKTDWSWGPVFGDFNNDGHKDLYVTNGFTRDLGDLDYLNFNENSPFVNPMANRADHYKSIIEQPGTKVANFAFKNNGNQTFSKVTKDWGLSDLSFSNGVATGDLDNDGDLDLVVSNINDHAFIYENKSEHLNHHYLKIKISGPALNPQALGTRIKLHYAIGIQFIEKCIYRGYLSTMDGTLHFGLGKQDKVDSLEVFWPDGKYTLLRNITVDTTLMIKYAEPFINPQKQSLPQFKFQEISESFKIKHLHREDPFMDFLVQPLIPHEHTLNGPALAVGDIDGDQLEDFFIGGAAGFPGYFFFQQENNSFEKVEFPIDIKYEDNGALFFDADNDGDQDLYVVSGGTFDKDRTPLDFQDRLYINNGSGNLTRSKEALSETSSSGSCVIASDFDKDGDLDLFVGGRISPGKYPYPPKSYLFQNQHGKFIDVTRELLPDGHEIGMVTSALWTDVDNDSWPDLMIVGEWMPITVFHNTEGQSFSRVNDTSLRNSNGWWNSLVSGDFDRDGDLDYIAGNLGLNTNYKASEKRPFGIYAKDFDNNGTVDPIMCQYYGEVNYPVALLDDLLEQISSMNRRFPKYNDYAKANFYQTFTKKEVEGALILESKTFESSYIENLGNSRFTIRPLPLECQTAPIFGMHVQDVNEDGNLDILMVGNSYATHVLIGRYDAFIGAYLMGDGKGNFDVIRGNQSGFFVDTDARALAALNLSDTTQLYIVASNSDSIKVFVDKDNKDRISINAQDHDVAALLELIDGTKIKHEYYYGSGYYSKSSRNLVFPKSQLRHVTLIDATDKKRVILIP